VRAIGSYREGQLLAWEWIKAPFISYSTTTATTTAEVAAC